MFMALNVTIATNLLVFINLCKSLINRFEAHIFLKSRQLLLFVTGTFCALKNAVLLPEEVRITRMTLKRVKEIRYNNDEFEDAGRWLDCPLSVDAKSNKRKVA